MNSTPNCADIHEKIVLAAYGELPDDHAHALSLHLSACPECREEQQQLLALKTLSAANPMLEPDANLVARSRRRLEDSLDLIPPRRWYDRLAHWMTRTATGLQAAPAAASLLLIAGAGLGTLGGYEFAERHAASLAQNPQSLFSNTTANSPARTESSPAADSPLQGTEVASVSGIIRRPDSNLVEVSYNQVEPRQLEASIDDPRIRQLLMLASQNGASPSVRGDSVGLLAAECRSGHGCQASPVSNGAPNGVANGAGNGAASANTDVRDALMVALRYDRSVAVRQKALAGLQPFVAQDMQVRDAVLEALLNDPEAQVRSAAISMLEPVEADTSVRQVLSTVALSDQNSHIRNASRLVLRRVSEIQ